MKKSLTILFLCASLTCAAQQHIPAKVKIELTGAQMQSLFAKVDSLQQLTLQTHQPSDWVQGFNARVSVAFQPLLLQVRQQLVVDSVKVVKPIKK